jgi:hypothetical protein
MKYSIRRQLDKNKYLSEDNFVLVYQMGKVGSSSIEHSLNLNNIPSYHIHTFDDHEEFYMYHNTHDVKKFFEPTKRLAYRLVLKHRKHLLQKRESLKIITLVRDPVATVLSRFFQDLHIQFIEGKKNESIHNDMNETYLHLEYCFDNHINKSYFSNWFDNELNRNFNIDIFKQETDKSQPSFRFSNNNRDVLLVKCESLSKLDSELSNFLQIDDFKLTNSNEAKNKWYSNIYSDFKKRYDFSKLFYMYDLPLYRHLYSDQEIEQFKSKWLTAMEGTR